MKQENQERMFVDFDFSERTKGSLHKAIELHGMFKEVVDSFTTRIKPHKDRVVENVHKTLMSHLSERVPESWQTVLTKHSIVGIDNAITIDSSGITFTDGFFIIPIEEYRSLEVTGEEFITEINTALINGESPIAILHPKGLLDDNSNSHETHVAFTLELVIPEEFVVG